VDHFKPGVDKFPVPFVFPAIAQPQGIPIACVILEPVYLFALAFVRILRLVRIFQILPTPLHDVLRDIVARAVNTREFVCRIRTTLHRDYVTPVVTEIVQIFESVTCIVVPLVSDRTSSVYRQKAVTVILRVFKNLVESEFARDLLGHKGFET